MFFYVSVLFILLFLKEHNRQNFAVSDSEFFTFLCLPTFLILSLFGKVCLFPIYWVYAEQKIHRQLGKTNILNLT